MLRSPGAVLLRIGPFTLYWYSLMIGLGIAAAIWVAYHEARRRGENPEQILDLALPVVLAAIVGARLYYVIFMWEFYRAAPWKILALWEGGLAIHGGLLGGFLGGILMARRRGLPLGRYADIVATGLPLAQAIGRWGNFFNQEAFGTPTDLPWKLYIDPDRRAPEFANAQFFHPTFLYESLWDLGVFVLLMGLLRKRLEPYPWALFLTYLGLYSLGRFFVEGLRTDSLMAGSLRAAQVVSLLLIALAVGGLAIVTRRRPAAR
ncbi:MAG: prolipoprotein diacylglyceryl transferase [Deltaproteobacteria bacterium]|nr:prolipoprotein diacylglyceryl transferase [Deltaproteobacteria bacterium]MBI3077230.1 prolipoprotein diacylglyceryl transferase [Deltaproteobacteria bacterium]